MSDNLSPELLSPLVSKLFTQKHYGFTAADFNVAASRFPAGLQIRCWEANDLEKYFPADRIADLKARRLERERAREECEYMLFAMSDADKAALLEGKLEDAPGTKKTDSRTSREATAATDSSRRSVSPSKKSRARTAEEDAEAKEKREKAKEEKEKAREEKERLKEQKEAEKEAKRLAKQAERDAKRQEQEEKKA